jgi:hypothetical protein
MREVLPHPPVRNCRNSLGGWLSQTVTCMPRTPSRTDLKTGDGPMHMVRYMFRKGSQPCTLFSECRGLEILPSFPAVKSARGNWSGHFCAQFAACGILPAFSLPLTFWLSLPRTTSGNIDDEVRQEPVEQRAGRTVGSADGPANPRPGTDVFGVRCNSRRRPQGSGADERRQRRRCDRGIPCGSSRSVSPHAHPSRVIAGRSGGRVCPWLRDAW